MTGTAASGGPVRWLAFDHPGSPEPVGLLRAVAVAVEYLDRDGTWRTDPALTLDLVSGRAREVDAAEAARIAERLLSGEVRGDPTGMRSGPAGDADPTAGRGAGVSGGPE